VKPLEVQFTSHGGKGGIMEACEDSIWESSLKMFGACG